MTDDPFETAKTMSTAQYEYGKERCHYRKHFDTERLKKLPAESYYIMLYRGVRVRKVGDAFGWGGCWCHYVTEAAPDRLFSDL